MPLLVEGRRVRLPQSAGDLVRAHPPLEERARLLRGQSVQQVGPQGLLYVQQRELAVTSPKDGSISILGSDDATTCHIVVLRHTGNGATCLTHCDGTDTKAEVPLIMNSIKSFSDHAQCGRLEVHLVGGFNDDRQLSQKLTHQLLKLNDREENENHFPIIYGIAVNIKTAEIYRASFQDRGPEEQLRAARALAGGPMISIYDAETEQIRIGPYSWTPFPHVDFWLQQDDKQILENLSTSPLAEPPHFVEHIRSTLMFLKKYPSPTNTLFPGNKALVYKKNEDGLWEKISSGN
ncbi:protein N-terminal asparagine amidohydrolase isoform X3 [Cebus imitator]|uniref:Protein N-terminal asparagine amidohydrolase isoform X3 n=1 Tax=Sapajus apella TaxID=9515 RepID=A0A6J3H6R2_SAPAP|nr:protein N-terminal asparagine amidohydrolase isoform X3 [Cebus imitator]XP_032125512.1 protein N-terminal asparagine amidohydrolase isoform X3 [Sapajus apella]